MGAVLFAGITLETIIWFVCVAAVIGVAIWLLRKVIGTAAAIISVIFSFFVLARTICAFTGVNVVELALPWLWMGWDWLWTQVVGVLPFLAVL